MNFKKVYIEITNICNKNCSFCSNDHRKKEEMSVENFEHILKELKPYTKYLYLHVKGEPTLHSRFLELLKLTEEYGYIVNITTNGTFLLKSVPTLLSVSNIRQINVSLHSFSNEEKYMESILETTDILLKETSIYMNYRFWTLENHVLTEDYKEMIRKIELHFNTSLLDLLETKTHVTIRPHLFLEEGDKFEWPTLSSSTFSESGTCYGLRTHFAILVDGTVIPCCLDSDGILSLGNIFEESLESILSSRFVSDMITGFQNGKLVASLCKHCSYRKIFDKEKQIS